MQRRENDQLVGCDSGQHGGLDKETSMNPTEYHPIRTSMMRNVHDRRFRFAHGDQADNTWSLPRSPTEWKPRFGSHGATLAISEESWFKWDRGIIVEEMGDRTDEECVAAMDRLCVFEDMLASIRRDGHPLIDLSSCYEALKNDPPTFLVENRELAPEFVGSMYIHFGSSGVVALGDREITGVYVNAERYPRGTIHGDLHFVGSDPNWQRAHEITFYDTLLTHQDAAVVMYEISPDGKLKFRIDAQDVVFGNEDNAYALLPFVKVGIDVALGKAPQYETEVRTEYFHGGPTVRPEHCRIDVADVSRRPSLEEQPDIGPGL